jgi:Thioesterase superfamily
MPCRSCSRARATASGTVVGPICRNMSPTADQHAHHPAETASVLTYRMGIQDANVAGNVHGGWIMKLCDDVAAIAATRHAGGRVVTATVDEMKFRSPVHVGDVLTLRATVNAAWRTRRWRSACASRPSRSQAGRSRTPARPISPWSPSAPTRAMPLPALTPAAAKHGGRAGTDSSAAARSPRPSGPRGTRRSARRAGSPRSGSPRPVCHHCRPPSAQVFDLARIRAAEPQPRFSDRVVGLGHRTEEPVGDRAQTSPPVSGRVRTIRCYRSRPASATRPSTTALSPTRRGSHISNPAANRVAATQAPTEPTATSDHHILRVDTTDGLDVALIPRVERAPQRLPHRLDIARAASHLARPLRR